MSAEKPEKKLERTAQYTNPLGKLYHLAGNSLNPPIGMVELTFACNLDCEFCYNSKVLNQLSYDELCDAFDQMKELGVFKLTLTGGEALVRRDFFDIAWAAKKRGFALTLFTNAVLLARDEMLDKVQELNLITVETSLHGASAETFDKQTQVKGSFKKFDTALRKMKARGMRCILKVTVTQYNQDELMDMKAYADEVGFPVSFDVHITPTDTGGTHPTSLRATQETIDWLYHESGLTIASEGFQREPGHYFCGVGTKSICLDPFGNVLPCLNYRKNMGNIRQAPMREIWMDSPVAHEIRAINKSIIDKMQAEHGELANFCDYCPGAAELETGSPFKVPEVQLMKAKSQQKLHRIRSGKSEPASAGTEQG